MYYDPYGLFEWRIDLPLAWNWLTGNGWGVDLSFTPGACDAYLEDESIQALTQSASVELEEEARRLAPNLAIGESQKFAVQGSRQSNVSTIYSLGQGRDRYVANAVVTRTNSGVSVTQKAAAIYRYDVFQDPFDLHKGQGIGSGPGDAAPNLYRKPFDMAIHCSCEFE